MKQFIHGLTGLAFVLLAACASIVGSDTQLVGFNSTPDKANIKIVDEHGITNFEGVTPTTVTLAKSTGHYFGGKTYTVTVSKDGFSPQTITLTHSANGWYIFGNIIFGGLIGWLAVDPFNGGMYTLNPKSVSTTLAENPQGQKVGYTDGTLHIMLYQDVPAAMRGELVRIDTPAPASGH